MKAPRPRSPDDVWRDMQPAGTLHTERRVQRSETTPLHPRKGAAVPAQRSLGATFRRTRNCSIS